MFLKTNKQTTYQNLFEILTKRYSAIAFSAHTHGGHLRDISGPMRAVQNAFSTSSDSSHIEHPHKMVDVVGQLLTHASLLYVAALLCSHISAETGSRSANAASTARGSMTGKSNFVDSSVKQPKSGGSMFSDVRLGLLSARMLADVYI